MVGRPGVRWSRAYAPLRDKTAEENVDWFLTSRHGLGETLVMLHLQFINMLELYMCKLACFSSYPICSFSVSFCFPCPNGKIDSLTNVKFLGSIRNAHCARLSKISGFHLKC